MAKGSHLFPSRTQKLSPSAPMVLGRQRPGRVGRRQARMNLSFLLAGFACREVDIVRSTSLFGRIQNIWVVRRWRPLAALFPNHSFRWEARKSKAKSTHSFLDHLISEAFIFLNRFIRCLAERGVRENRVQRSSSSRGPDVLNAPDKPNEADRNTSLQG